MERSTMATVLTETLNEPKSTLLVAAGHVCPTGVGFGKANVADPEQDARSFCGKAVRGHKRP